MAFDVHQIAGSWSFFSEHLYLVIYWTFTVITPNTTCPNITEEVGFSVLLKQIIFEFHLFFIKIIIY